MNKPSELFAHRSTSAMQMSDSDETSSSSGSDVSDNESSSEEESGTDESGEDVNQSTNDNYLHHPWLLQNRDDIQVPQSNAQAQLTNQSPTHTNESTSEDAASSSTSDSNGTEEEEVSSHEQLQLSAPVHRTSKKNDLPEWETNPEVYGLRRSSRQRKEPSRLVVKDETSDDDRHRKKPKKRRESGARLSGSSDDELSEYESHKSRKVRSRPTGRTSKLTQLRAKLQGRKVKNIRGRQARTTNRGGRGRKAESTLSDDSSSDDNQPIRASSRIQRNNKISYKENESTQETDSDEIVEAGEWNGVEDDGSEIIEKIMDCRVGRLGATGAKTTAYACTEEGDPNADFDPQEEQEMQYLIKWKGWSHPHNTWESETTLQAQGVKGMKKFENYVKRKEEIDLWLRAASAEDREYYFCQNEMNKNVVSNYCKVERVIARSSSRNANNLWDYQVKWCGLPYSECTWEEETLLKDCQTEIDAFEMRQDNPCVPKRDCKVHRSRPRFVQMSRQPDWLKGLTLRDYQLDGVNWLAHSWCKGNSVILADEMGLGKTIQSITFLSYLYHTHELYGLYLIIVPLSTMTAWQTEYQTWAPFMNVIVYMGDQTSRATIREVEWTFPNKRYKFNVVLTSYEILLKDKAFLGSHTWEVIAVDEAHRLKNDDSLLYRSLKEFKSNHRLLITGTPLQNSLKELWALLHFIMPEKFHSWADFEEDHGRNRDSGYASLHGVLQPFLLRRVKKDVEKSLPSKVEQILRIPMSSLQKQYYKWLLTKNYTALTRGNRGGFTSFCNIIMELKKCCNHAYLVKPPEQDVASAEKRLQNLLRNSGKMVLLDKLLLRLKENGHRVLIFSQMVRMLDIIQDYLISRRLQFQRLDGSVASDKRKRALDHFNAPASEDFCFLLSTRAGGLGINLATADTVIIFDSDWNPMNDLQAQARAHRIGQKNQVNIYRLVCAGSVEEDIIERAKKKMVLDHLVIQRMDTSGKTVLFKNTAPSSTTNNPFNKDELSAILKFGAEELFQEAEGEEKEPECDIDEILQRAETRQDHVEPSHAGDLLSAFKVATFNLDEEEKTDVGKDWDDIIPEKDRSKVAEENRQKQEAELYLPRRARKKIKINAGSDSENSDTNSSEEEDETADDLMTGSKKRGRPNRSGLREGEDYVRGFTTAEVRRFVRSYRKFGDPLNRLDAVARDAELSEQSEADLRRLGQQLHEKLHSMAADAQDSKEDGTKQGRGRGPSFRLAGVSVSVKTTLACSDDLLPLDAVIPRDTVERKNFRLNLPIKPMWQWDCSWDLEDDARLLVGIYEYGMGSWEQIQSDPALKLDKKILRPNGEKPQAKQLQSRAEYLIKFLRRAQDQNHPGASYNAQPRKKTSRDSKSAPTVAETKVKRRSRKIKSKATVDSVNSDLDELPGPGSNPGNDQHLVNANGMERSVDHEPSEKKKVARRKRKANDDDAPNSLTAVNDNTAVKAKKKKTAKDPPQSTKKISQKAKKGPVHITLESDPVPVGTEEFSDKLDPEAFRDCKERLRPVKKALKQLDRHPTAPSGCEEQVKNEHTRRCLLQIGDRVIQCLREFHDPQEIKTMRRNLWAFVSQFTEHNAEKLHKMYKAAIKRREHERKVKNEKAHKSHSTESAESKKPVTTDDVKSNQSEQNKSRKIQNKVASKKVSPAPDGSGESRGQPTSNVGASPSKDKMRRQENSLPEQRSNDRNSNSTRFRNSPPQKFYDDRYPHGKPMEEREHWNRRGPSPSSEYRGRDNYVKRNRSPFNDARIPPPGRSPPDARLYNDLRDPERHMREYDRRSPPRHRLPPPDRYDRWRHSDFRGSPPPPDYHVPAPDWEHRHPPPRGYSPTRGPYPYRPRSPSGRSPHSEYRMQPQHRRRHPEHYPHPENRGPRPSRYGPYSGSPVGSSPSAYSPPLSEPSLSSAVPRLEKT